MHKKKVAIFAISRDACALARFSHLLSDDYELSHLFVPRYMRLTNEDINRIDGGCLTGITCTDYHESLLANNDILFMECCESVNDIGLYQKVMHSALELGKEVILSRKLHDRLNAECWQNDDKKCCGDNRPSRSLL